MIPKSNDGAVRVLSLSYGKDSMACLGACEKLGWPLDRIVTADVWATDTIPADLPEMVAFKDYADKVILDRYGIVVEHYRAALTFEERFYTQFTRGSCKGRIYGFPFKLCNWCNSDLKRAALDLVKKHTVGVICYIGIAADEPERFHVLSEEKLSPLVASAMTEADCLSWCKENNLLSPIYSKIARGGCWFCYNQTVNQLRLLRQDHPDLWALLLKWDSDSPTSFRPDGHSVHDFDRRFALEESGLVPRDRRFRWTML